MRPISELKLTKALTLKICSFLIVFSISVLFLNHFIDLTNLCIHCDKAYTLLESAAVSLFIVSISCLLLYQKKTKRWKPYLIGILILILAVQFHTVFVYDYNLDGLVHLHYTWMIYKGNLPYLDFITMDNPLFHYALSPFLYLIPEVYHVYFLEIVMFLFYLLTLLLIYKTFNILYKDNTFGLIATLLTASNAWFFANMFIIRPDVPMTFLLMGAVYYQIKYLSGISRPKLLSLAGLLSGIAYLVKQKSVFILPGQALSLICFKRLKLERISFLIKEQLFFFLPLFSVIFIFFIWLVHTKSLWLYYLYTLRLPFLVERSYYSISNNVFSAVFLFNIAFWIIGLFSVYYFLRHRKETTNALIWMIVSLLLCLEFIARTPYTHYFLPMIPLLSILSALYLSKLKTKGLLLFIVLVLTFSAIFQSVYFHNVYSKLSGNKEAVDFVLEHSTEEDYFQNFGLWKINRNPTYPFWYDRLYWLEPERAPIGLVAQGIYNESLLFDSFRVRPSKFVYIEPNFLDQPFVNKTFRDFVFTHFNPIGKYNLYIPSAQINCSKNTHFEVLYPGKYSSVKDAGDCTIDEIKILDHTCLSEGIHRCTCKKPSPISLELDYLEKQSTCGFTSSP